MHDRGSIKWTSLMLPEHVQLLRQIWSEDKKVTKPSLDEQELEVLNNQMLEAYRQNYLIKIDYYQDNQILECEGTIKKLDPINQIVLIKDLNEEVLSIPFSNIYHIV